MASGSFNVNGGANGTSIYIKVDWESVANVEGNYSDLTVTSTLYHGRINMYGVTDDIMISAGGTKKYATSPGLSHEGPTKLATKTFKVSHEADGSKSINIGASYILQITYSGVWVDTISGSKTVDLDNIPRTSDFTIPASSEAGEDFNIGISSASSAFTHNIKLEFGGRSKSYTGIRDIKTVSVPLAWLDQIPKTSSGTLTVSVTTYSGNTAIGSKSKTMKVTVPSTVVPSVVIKAITPMDQTWGIYIQGRSKVKVEVDAAGSYGSSISSYSFSGGGYTGKSNPFTTGILLNVGENTLSCTVTDSRGQKASVETRIKVVGYEKPKLTSVLAYRSNEDGVADRAGGFAFVKALGSCSNCEGNNSYSLSVAYAGTDGIFSTEESLEDGVAKVIGAGALDTRVGYVLRVTVSDYFTSVSQEITIQTDKYRGVFGEEYVGLNRYPPDGGYGTYVTQLHASEGAEFDGSVSVEGDISVGGGLKTIGAATFSNNVKTSGVRQNQNYAYVHSASGTSGAAGAVLIARIVISSSYKNVPLAFRVARRNDIHSTILHLRFANADSSDPALSSFRCTEAFNYPAYIYRSAAGKWDLYVAKSEAYDTITIQDYYGAPYMAGVTVTWMNTQVSSVPTGATQATNQNYDLNGDIILGSRSDKKGILGHKGTTSLYLTNEAGGDTYFNGSSTYRFDKTVAVKNASVCADNHIYFGEDYDLTADKAIKTNWADGSIHDIVSRANGLTAAFGWAGSSSYSTVSRMRGRTCQYQNASGTTTLSDERMKKDFTTLENWNAFYDAIEPVAFRLKNGNSGRFHIGFKAQQIENVLEANGLSTQDFAGLIKMQYEPDSDDPEGAAAYEAAGISPGDDEYGLIYTEFVALNTYRIQQLQSRVSELENQVDELKKMVQAVIEQKSA